MDDKEEYPLISAIMLAGKCTKDDVLKGILSFKHQSYPYKELIIINNAATQYECSDLDLGAEANVFIIDTPFQLSAGMARNVGLSQANGQIIAQFDSNYYYHPDRLSVQVMGLAQHNAKISILTHTLQYNYTTGYARYYTNPKNAILNTMVYVRPEGIDYDNVDKLEEKSILEKLIQAGNKAISISRPELAIKRIRPNNKYIELKNCGLQEHELSAIQTLLIN